MGLLYKKKKKKKSIVGKKKSGTLEKIKNPNPGPKINQNCTFQKFLQQDVSFCHFITNLTILSSVPTSLSWKIDKTGHMV